MPTSEKQRLANQRNARKSTGPRTAAGKAVSSRNAVKHGLYARDIVLNGPHLKESEAEYRQLVKSLIDELKPDGALQVHLVLKMANCLWRSRRAITAETARVSRDLTSKDLDLWLRLSYQSSDQMPEDENEARKDIGRRTAEIIRSDAILTDSFADHLIRYEAHLDRQFTRAYQLLRHLQSTAATPDPPPPPKNKK